MKRLRYESGVIDSVDVRLLTLLEAHGRTSIADLARALGMAGPSVSERLKRLEESGVIRRFTVEINPAALGYTLIASIRVRPVAGQLQRVTALLAELPEIVQCDRVTGDDCFIATAYLRSVGDLERLTDRLAAFAQTNSSIIQSSPVRSRLPPLRP